jgi:hypothetical protein
MDAVVIKRIGLTIFCLKAVMRLERRLIDIKNLVDKFLINDGDNFIILFLNFMYPEPVII